MTPSSLAEWEHQLKPSFATLHLIGELEVSEEDTKEIGSLIRRLISDFGYEEATHRLERRHPRVLTAFLVFEGLYHYSSGDYWSHVCKTTSLPRDVRTTYWGQIFETILANYKLPSQFPGHRYVGPILVHGGIPRSALSPFFEKLLQPAIKDSRLIQLPAGKLIDRWQREQLRYGGMIVSRFLNYGGKFAIDFVERCREMAQETILTGSIPSPQSIGLPTYVVEEYRRWLSTQPNEDEQDQATSNIVRRTVEQCLRLRRPSVYFDPWGEGIMLKLPSQFIPRNIQISIPKWQFVINDSTQERVATYQSNDLGIFTIEDYQRIEANVEHCLVRLLYGERCLREWEIEELVVHSQYPFLAFDASSGELISRRDTLRAQSIWLVLSPGSSLQLEKYASEALPRLAGAWSAWQAVEIDLIGQKTLDINVANERLQFPIIDSGEPHLVGNALLLGRNASPLYIGHTPTLELMRINQAGLSGWKLELLNVSAANPSLNIDTSIEMLGDELLCSEGRCLLPLNSALLLGDKPFGQYRLRIRDPLKRTTEFIFSTIPHLEIVGPEISYLTTNPVNNEPVTFLFELDSTTKLCTDIESEQLPHEWFGTEAEIRKLYEIQIPIEQSELTLQLLQPGGSVPTANVPITIEIPRLRWSLLSEHAMLKWHTFPILLSLEELEEELLPRLLLDIPMVDQKVTQVDLHFYDENKKQILEIRHSHQRLKAGVLRFDLRNALETLRRSSAPAWSVYICIQNHSKTIEEQVMYIKRGVTVQKLNIDFEQPERENDEPASRLSISWSPNPKVRHRKLRLWSATQPWKAPYNISISDEASGHIYVCVDPNQLIAGVYFAQILVADPWAPVETPTRPTMASCTTLSVQIGNLKQRIADLDSSITGNKLGFESVLERALLCQALGNLEQVNADITWCCQHIEQATALQIHTLIEGFNANSDVKLMKFRLLESSTLQRLLNRFEKGEVDLASQAWFREQIVALLEHVALTETSGRLLNRFPDEAIRRASAQRMITLSIPIGVENTVELLKTNTICLEEAASYFKENMHFSLHQLSTLPLCVSSDHILNHLTKISSLSTSRFFTRVGEWIRTQAGWGKVVAIKESNGSTYQFASYNAIDAGDIRITISLHGDSESETIIYDTASRRLEFPGAPDIYVCGKCHAWATAKQELLYYGHNHTIHGGVHSEFDLSVVQQLFQTNELEFSSMQPRNLWE